MWNGNRRTFDQSLEPPDSALFEVVMALGGSSELVSLEIDPTKGEFAGSSTTFNLFAITGMAVEK